MPSNSSDHTNYSTDSLNSRVKGQNDLIFLFLIFLIVCMGMLFSYSTSNSISFRLTGDYYFFFKRHVTAVFLGIVIFFIAWKLEISVLLNWYKIAIIASIAVLLLVFIPGVGKAVSGSNRWVDLQIISFQASEIAKIGLVLYLAVVLPLKKDKIDDFTKSTLPPMVMVGILVALIAIEPDLSTALLFLSVSLWMFFLAGMPTVHLLTVLVASLPFFLTLMEFKQYFIRRFVAFDPFIDPYGRGYHLIQSFISFQNGSWWGTGPGKSSQKLKNLPEAHTDFLFSIITEEIGFIGGCMVILLFALLVYRGILIAVRQEDMRFSLLAYGIIVFIGIEAMIHFSVTLGIVPTTGLPLPFMSYGRTSIVVHFFMAGLVLNLSRRITHFSEK